MNESLRELLRQGADSVDRPPLDVGDLVAQAERRLRHRRLATLAASIVAVAVVVGSSVALSRDPQRPAPAPPGPQETQHVLNTPRPLTYAEGETIHWGGQTIDVGQVVTFVEATDDGVVFITDDDDGRRGDSSPALWFSDGSAPEQIGEADIHHMYDVPVMTANSGSLVAWREPGVLDAQVVVYDSEQRRVVARLANPGDFAAVAAVSDDRVYWTRDEGTEILRYDVATDTRTVVSIETYHAELATNPRMLVIGKAPYDDPAAPAGVTQRLAFFKLDGRRLVPTDSVSRGAEGNTTAPTTLVDGRPLRLRVPRGYGAGVETLVAVQWLDDEHLVLFAQHEHSEYPRHFGDFLTCPLPTGTCDVVVPASGTTPYAPPGEVP